MSQIQVPQDWKFAHLEDICRKITDGDHQTPTRQSTGKMLLSAKNVLNGKIDFKNIQYVSENDFRNSRKRCMPEEGDVLFSCVGSIGRIAVVGKNSDFMLVRTVALLKPNDDILPEYLAYFLRSKFAQNKIFSMVAGSAVQHIYLFQIKKIPIFYPKISVQKKIVQKLDYILGQLEEKKRKVLELNELNKKRLEVITKYLHPWVLEQIIIENKKKDWPFVKLKDISKSNYGYTAKAHPEKVGHPYLRITDINMDGTLKDNFVYVIMTKNNLKKYKLEKGDIVIARTGATAGKSFFYDLDKDMVFASYLVRFKPNQEKIIPKFLYFTLNSTSFWRHVKNKQTRGAQPNINANLLGDFELLLPKVSEQKYILRELEKGKKNIMNLQLSFKPLFEKLDQSNRYLNNLNNSILAHAFIGKLVN